MRIERLVDENNKLELRVVNDDGSNYTNLKAFKKDFVSEGKRSVLLYSMQLHTALSIAAENIFSQKTQKNK